MDAVLQNIERQFLTDRIRTSASVGRVARHRLQSSFGSAFWALLFALVFPLTVFIFGSIRAREFQLPADPRWVRFAPFMSTQSAPVKTVVKSQTHPELGRIPVQNASIRTEELPSTTTDHRPLIDDDMTGSVSGHHPIEVPIPGEHFTGSDTGAYEQYEPRDRSERRSTSYRNSELEAASNSLKSTSRIEAQMKHVRQRLDQLAEIQHQHHAADSYQHAQILDQQSQLLRREAELSVALNELSRNINDNLPVPSDERPNVNDDVNSEPAFAVSPTDNIEEISSSDESIRIRRDTGRDHVDVFTMKVQEADIRQFFTRLSEVARVGILPSPAVQGQISLHLHEVRLEAALKAIVKSRDYVVEREHGIFVIRTAEEAGRPKPTNGRLALKSDGSK
jgi:hypothetical protein